MSSNNPQPNWTLPLVLSTVLAAGGTFVYWHQYSQKPKQERAEAQQKKPLALPSEDTQIAMIKVKTGKGLIELKCEDLAAKKCRVSDTGKWVVTHPVQLAADNDNVKEYLNNVTGLLATETIDLKDDPAEKRQALLTEYGLNDQQRTDLNTQFVELVAEDGKRYTAWFGGQHPIGDKNFVARAVDGKLQDDTIYLLTQYHKSSAAKDLTYFRDKTLFRFARGDVQSFEATTSKGRLSGKKVDGLWQINGLPGEHDRIETALASIAKTEARGFPEPIEYKDAKPVAKYELKTQDKTYTIDLLAKTVKAQEEHGADDGHGHSKSGTARQFFARVNTRPEVVEVDSVLVTQIDKGVNDLRKTAILGDAEKATATKMLVEIKGSKNPLSLELKQGVWPKKAQSLLDALQTTRVVQFLPAVPAGGTDELTVTIGDDKNAQKSKYRLVHAKDKVYAVDLLSGRKEAMELNDAMKSALPFTEEAWKVKE